MNRIVEQPKQSIICDREEQKDREAATLQHLGQRMQKEANHFDSPAAAEASPSLQQLQAGARGWGLAGAAWGLGSGLGAGLTVWPKRWDILGNDDESASWGRSHLLGFSPRF